MTEREYLFLMDILDMIDMRNGVVDWATATYDELKNLKRKLLKVI